MRRSAPVPLPGIHGSECGEAKNQLATGRRYELHFQSMLQRSRDWTFPCDSEGHVDMNAMTERDRINYLFARALMGIDLDLPRIREI